MIAQAIQCRLDQVSLSKLIMIKKIFVWYDSNGDIQFYGVMMLCVVMVECDPERKTNAKSAIFDNDMSKMLEHSASTMILIAD